MARGQVGGSKNEAADEKENHPAQHSDGKQVCQQPVNVPDQTGDFKAWDVAAQHIHQVDQQVEAKPPADEGMEQAWQRAETKNRLENADFCQHGRQPLESRFSIRFALPAADDTGKAFDLEKGRRD